MRDARPLTPAVLLTYNDHALAERRPGATLTLSRRIAMAHPRRLRWTVKQNQRTPHQGQV